MKRSKINAELIYAKQVLKSIAFYLPPFSQWSPERWKNDDVSISRIKLNGLGWDITDFGSDDFENVGAVIFTLRNGNCTSPEKGTPYAEKVIVLREGQQIPLHYHWMKTEDIINRGGGSLMMQLFNETSDHKLNEVDEVIIHCDGIRKILQAGTILELLPGESITLTPNIFHRFWAKKGAGTLVCGEVSSVNDDNTDNFFLNPSRRFASIEEDEAPIHLLCNEYSG